ncbi:hypothetical protein GGI42DRAFT_158578 [Trichoderma sp. SZMC 28013]
MAGIIQAFRKVYHPLGFTKAYNFILWFIFCGGLFGFVLARLEFLNFNGIYCNPFIPNTAGPAQCYGWNKRDLYLVGIKLHLYCVLPAATLACFQFTPIIRHKVLLFHRINGYIILLLALPAIAGAIMIAPVSVGGDLATQGVIGVNAIMFLVSLALAYYNVKRLQIEQHRAWMLRGWFYAGAIITTRLIAFPTISIISVSKDSIRPYYVSMPCDELTYMFFGNITALVAAHPECSDPNAWAAVLGDLSATTLDQITAAFYATFANSWWLALTIHAIGVEIYLHLTPAEAERLRNISYQRQLEAGFKDPGRAGTTADGLGDAVPWIPSETKSEQT